MSNLKKLKVTKQTLKRQLLESNASHAYVYECAHRNIDKASTDRLMASGVVMTLTVLGGREIMNPVMFRDGLSEATITAIKADLKRSYDLATQNKL